MAINSRQALGLFDYEAQAQAQAEAASLCKARAGTRPMAEQPPPEVPVIVIFAHANGFNREVWAAVLEEFHALAPAELSHRLNVRLIVSAVPRCPAGRLEDSAHAVSL